MTAMATNADFVPKRQKRRAWRDDLARHLFPDAHRFIHEMSKLVCLNAGGDYFIEWEITKRADLSGMVRFRWLKRLGGGWRQFEQSFEAFYLSALVVGPEYLAFNIVRQIQATE